MSRTLNDEVSILNFNGGASGHDIKDAFTRDMICDIEETSDSASREYSAGNTFIWTDRKVYKAKTNISLGTALSSEANGNIEAIGDISSLISNRVLLYSGLACSAITGNFCVKSDPRITSNHVFARVTFSKPSAITSDTYVCITEAGSLKISGTCTDSNCTAEVLLIRKDN